jgi:hypothetical protein
VQKYNIEEHSTMPTLILYGANYWWGPVREFWNDFFFKAIGNGLGSFIKTAKLTREKQLATYARNCINIDLSKPLQDYPQARGSLHKQNRDYDKITFKCQFCLE